MPEGDASDRGESCVQGKRAREWGEGMRGGMGRWWGREAMSPQQRARLVTRASPACGAGVKARGEGHVVKRCLRSRGQG